MKSVFVLLVLVIFLVLGFIMTFFYQRAQIEQHKADTQNIMEQVSRITTNLTEIPEDIGSQSNSTTDLQYSESY